VRSSTFFIFGAGVTGLSAAYKTEGFVYEANIIPGGICASYYVDIKGNKFYHRVDEETYRFEIGGGHWIFGADNEVLRFITSFVPVKTYNRKSAVYLVDLDLYVPYPLQNHLYYLPKDIREKAAGEIIKNLDKNIESVSTMADWLELNFGKTLCELFFFPFHQLYTAGLFTEIAPQDKFKTPVNKELILKGLNEETPPIGYNATFVYPQNGLDELIRNIEKRCNVHYNKKAVKIDLNHKEVFFEDGSGVKYEKIFSTLPLNKVLQMINISFDDVKLPYTSVSVINIGAKKGEKCPQYHWIYIPKSKSGFHRVGFYSNVDNSFLPLSARKDNSKVSIYVEKAYKGGTKLSDEDIKNLCENVVKELKDWKFIEEVEVVDHNFVEVAYTWKYPDYDCIERVIEELKKYNIYQTGRYGKWKFQGIAESIKDGVSINL